MNYIIDVVAVIILVLSIIWGARKGFIKSVMGLVSLAIAIALAVNFQSFAAGIIKDNVIEPYFVNKTSEQFSSLMNAGDSVVSPEQIFDEEPEELVEATNNFGQSIEALENFYEENIKGLIDSEDIKGISEKLSQFLVGNTVDIISNVLGFIAVFILALIALYLVQILLDLIFKLPILKAANKLLGSVLGAVKGIVLVVILINVLFILANTENVDSGIWNANVVSNSYTYGIAYTIGLIF